MVLDTAHLEFVLAHLRELGSVGELYSRWGGECTPQTTLAPNVYRDRPAPPHWRRLMLKVSQVGRKGDRHTPSRRQSVIFKVNGTVNTPNTKSRGRAGLFFS